MEKSTTPANYFYSLSHKTTTFCILFLCFVLTQGWTQTFEQVLPLGPPVITEFDGVSGGSIAFADVDGDNDQDVLITGYADSGRIAKLYANDGNGGYSLVSGTPFEGVNYSSIAFADIDGDNDQDVLITGNNNFGESIAKLYTNDGNGSYSLVSGTPFDGVSDSSTAFADIDGDNDQDVLIIGLGMAKLYTNDGNGGYSLVSNTPFDGVSWGSIAFADVDGDNDQDILITGSNNVGEQISNLYANNGDGGYSLVSGTPFDGVIGSSIAFADVDGDNDLDVLITGGPSQIAKLYSNDGNGGYSLVSGTPFDGVSVGSIAFADIDGDNDQDVLITGDRNFQGITKLYANDGNGGYSLVSGTPFEGVNYSSIAFADIDGDNDQDVLITGNANNIGSIAKLYTNDGNGSFSLVSGNNFEGVSHGSIAFADVDGDNAQDVLITGYNVSGPISKLYTNDGNSSFSLVLGTPFEGVNASSIAFANVDGDNDQDILITGLSNFGPISKLYTNDGNGGYSLVSGIPFDGVYGSSIAFADVDGDNNQDVLITGYNGSGPISKLYTNDGNGGYSLVSNTPFDGVSWGSIAFADVDGDNDQDLLITGYNNSERIAKLYTNDGNGGYTLVSGTPFDGVESSSIAFTDVDGDNDQDVVITGYSNSGPISKLYTNDGNGGYTLVSGNPFEGVFIGSIAFADVDGDNDQDVLITGVSDSGRISKLYTNDGNGGYTLVPVTPFEGVYYSSIAFADVDGDNDQDVLITGYNNFGRIAKLYRNTTHTAADAGSSSSICSGNSAIIGATALTGNTYSWVSSPVGFTSTAANPTVSPTVTTTYTLTQTITATGFTKSGTVTITVNPLPAANAGSTSSICSGNSATIGAAAVTGNTYSWVSSPIGFTSITANPTVSPTVTTTYTLTETITATGCAKSNDVTVTISDIEIPTIICTPDIIINTTPGLCTGTTSLSAPIVSDNCTISFGNALSFNGGYVEVPHNDSLNPTDQLTLETWVKRTSNGLQESLVEKYAYQGNTFGYLLRITEANKAFTMVFNNSFQGLGLTGFTTIIPNVWYHLAATFNRNTGDLKLYVNGVLDGQITGISGLPTTPGTQSLKIGARGDDAGTRLTNGGVIDEARVWNIERSQAQIQADMNKELSAQVGLVAMYHFNQGSAGNDNSGLTAAMDDSGNGFNGTLNGFSLTGSTSNWVLGNVVGGRLSVINDAPNEYPIGTTTVTWTATDESNNVASCTQTVTVIGDPNVTYYADTDNDTFGDNANSLTICTGIPTGYLTNNTDCAPADATKWQSASLYIDVDGDNYDYGSATVCYGAAIPAGYKATTLGSDCNDNNANIHPGKAEICGNGIDDNCDGQVDEGCPSKTLLNISDATVYESAGTVELTVTLTKTTNVAVSVNYKTIDGTATSRARKNNPADYTAASGTLTIPAGSQSGTISVSILRDNITEPSEYFDVLLSRPVNAAISDGSGRVTIMDGGLFTASKATITKTTVSSTKEPNTIDILESLAVAPNPVKTDAQVRFSLIEDSNVTLRLFDFNGREIYNLYSGNAKAKQVYEVGFLRNNLMSGVYIIKLTTDRGNSYNKRIIVE